MELLNTVESNNLQCYNVCCKRTLLVFVGVTESGEMEKSKNRFNELGAAIV